MDPSASVSGALWRRVTVSGRWGSWEDLTKDFASSFLLLVTSSNALAPSSNALVTSSF